jgi:sporulation protein YlmC with PRC-barrel domain
MYRQAIAMRSAATIIGEEVRNREGENLGTIEDFMIDLERGCIAYSILALNGVLGMGDKLFAVPWSALNMSVDDECFMMNVPREVLENAPAFEKDNWPDMSNPEWGQAIYTYYGMNPYWENL